MEAGVGSAISVDTSALEDIGAQVGSDMEIYYTGNIRETSPAQLRPTKWEMATDLRHRAYTDSWLDPETAQPLDDMIDPVIISRIYSNCFFARPVVPMPYEIKFNGELPPEWCVGDQVTCTCENILYDQDNQRMEADFISLAPNDWQMDPDACYKPVIYLYPEEETQVSVHLTLDGDRLSERLDRHRRPRRHPDGQARSDLQLPVLGGRDLCPVEHGKRLLRKGRGHGSLFGAGPGAAGPHPPGGQ